MSIPGANRGELGDVGQLRWLPSCAKPRNVEVRKVTGRPFGFGQFSALQATVRVCALALILKQFRFTPDKGHRVVAPDVR